MWAKGAMRPRLSVSRSAVELIKAFEGFRSKAAKLDDGRWTIGYGHTLTAREGARRMIAAGSKESGRGRVLLVASLGAHKVLPGLAAYCASKAGVVTMGKALAREWANRGINVNSICPGFISTELNDEFLESEAGRKMVAGFPRRRLMREDDLDATVIHLLSDASRGITGAAFDLDDGQGL